MKAFLLLVSPPILNQFIKSLYFTLLGIKHKKINNYEDEKLIKSILLKHESYKKIITDGKVVNILDLKNLYGFLLAKLPNPASIVDFGGGPGTHHTVIKKLFPSHSFKWLIIETPNFVKVAKKQRTPEIHYLEKISQISEPVNLVYSSGALQCTNNPLAYLSELVKLRAKYLVITRTPLTNTDRFAAKHKSFLTDNGPGDGLIYQENRAVSYPIIIENTNDVERVIQEYYEIKTRFLEQENLYKYKGIKVNYYGYFCILRGEAN